MQRNGCGVIPGEEYLEDTRLPYEGRGNAAGQVILEHPLEASIVSKRIERRPRLLEPLQPVTYGVAVVVLDVLDVPDRQAFALKAGSNFGQGNLARPGKDVLLDERIVF